MIVESGLKVIFVPVLLPAFPVLCSGALGTPRAYSCSQVDFSRQISSCRNSTAR